jgi:protein arginine kinase activator
MKCERCHQREATIHLSQTTQGKTIEQNLCEDCAHELGIDANYESVFGDIFSQSMLGGSIFNTTGGIPAFGKPATRNLVCSHCGQTYDDFRKTGLFGCSHCYEAFADRLDPVFRRVQGGTHHVGRKLKETASQQEQQILNNQLAELKQQLQKAVQVEDYETACHLRDQIKVLTQPAKAAEPEKPTDKQGKGGNEADHEPGSKPGSKPGNEAGQGGGSKK